MEIDAESLRSTAVHVRLVAFGLLVLFLLVLFLLDNKRILCINLCWRFYVISSLTLAAYIAASGIPNLWYLTSSFVDLWCAYYWCKRWEEISESGP